MPSLEVSYNQVKLEIRPTMKDIHMEISMTSALKYL